MLLTDSEIRDVAKRCLNNAGQLMEAEFARQVQIALLAKLAALAAVA